MITFMYIFKAVVVFGFSSTDYKVIADRQMDTFAKHG